MLKIASALSMINMIASAEGIGEMIRESLLEVS